MPLRIDSEYQSEWKKKNIGRQPALWVLAGLSCLALFVWPFLTPGDGWAGIALYAYLTVAWLATIVALFFIGRSQTPNSDTESETNR